MFMASPEDENVARRIKRRVKIFEGHMATKYYIQTVDSITEPRSPLAASSVGVKSLLFLWWASLCGRAERDEDETSKNRYFWRLEQGKFIGERNACGEEKMDSILRTTG
jgi:hypothetical protein